MLYDSEDDAIMLDDDVGENAGVNDGVGVDVGGGGWNNQIGVNNWAEIDPNNLNAEEGYYSTYTSLDGDEGPIQEDINKVDVEFTNFAQETENIFANEENDMNIGNSHQLVKDLVPEMEWPTVHAARAYIRRWSILNKVEYHQIKNEGYRLRFICIEPKTCNWLFYAIITPDGHTFKLRKSSVLKYICKRKGKTSNKLAHVGWVTNEAEHTMKIIRFTRPVDVIELILLKFGLDISYYTTWNAWTICMEKIVGSFDDGYVVQPELCRQILSANLGGLARTSKDVKTNMWMGTCVAYKAPFDGGTHLEGLVWGAAKAWKQTEKQEKLDKLKVDNPEAHDWLVKEPFEHWARSHFDFTAKCEHITNNFLESFNNWILKIRDKLLHRALEKLNLMMIKLMYDRRNKAAEWNQDGLVPRAEEHIAKMETFYGQYHLEGVGDGCHVGIGAMVKGGELT
ncbi:hypothetical protein GIB67_036618 [Kingdonia uniflora]|uniref:Transposase MuDR plant domain-containing protein n=1 Tax=Kingdonia uniflora TaxID=39325 RepID=A0A7J7M0K8_9MAGN|nr:hypothetical protein GIB67_036618 [Kingdonia uniflora]